jgi:molybdenum cofactor biosynthesis enzyme MoaA
VRSGRSFRDGHRRSATCDQFTIGSGSRTRPLECRDVRPRRRPVRLVRWSGNRGFDQYLPLSMVRTQPQRQWTLDETDYCTGGPARYYVVRETGCRLGMITPLTHNFRESCNRVRLACTGTPLRRSESDNHLEDAIRAAIARKPKGHDFVIDRRARMHASQIKIHHASRIERRSR